MYVPYGAFLSSNYNYFELPLQKKRQKKNLKKSIGENGFSTSNF